MGHLIIPVWQISIKEPRPVRSAALDSPSAISYRTICILRVCVNVPVRSV